MNDQPENNNAIEDSKKNGGVLTKGEIQKRRSADIKDRLVITPLLDPEEQIGESSVDIRLGTEFIMTRRRAFTCLDVSGPRVIEEQIGRYQERVRVEFREKFVLHPNELVLGSTLEYIKLPSDLCCYVIGRSSWGRVGLIIATATAVAPNFKGVITLEMINLGEVPLVLYPGIRIAQLVFHQTVGMGEYGGRYDCPTGPQFSRVHLDPDLIFWCPQ